MTELRFYDTKTVSTPSGSLLTLNYYLTISTFNSLPIYGIQIHSVSKMHSQTEPIKSEVVSKISYSISYVSSLLDSCVKYLVTPSDLLSALDLLMNETL